MTAYTFRQIVPRAPIRRFARVGVATDHPRWYEAWSETLHRHLFTLIAVDEPIWLISSYIEAARPRSPVY